MSVFYGVKDFDSLDSDRKSGKVGLISSISEAADHVISGLDCTHTIRRAGEQKITFSKLLVLGDVCDHGCNIKDHSASVLLLTRLSIDLQLNVYIRTVRNGALVDIFGYCRELV